MRIIMILPNPFYPDVRVYNEAKTLIDRGNSVEILCWDKTPDKGYPQEDRCDGIRIKRFREAAVAGTGLKQLGAYLRYIKRCRRYLKTAEYDILHCHDLDGALCGYLSRVSGTSYIFDMHEFYEKGPWLKRILIHAVVNLLVQHAAAVIYVGSKSLTAAPEKQKSKYHQLRNYPNLSMLKEIQKTESDVLRISYIGMVRNQMPEFQALAKSVQGLDKVRVDIYGTGVDYPKLLELEKKCNNFYVHGKFNWVEEICEIYRNTDVSFIAYDPSNPNYQGDFEPVKLYESIVTETPFIATAALGPGRMAEENGFGIAVDTRNASELRAAVLQMCDPAVRSGFAAREHTQADQYDWNRSAEVLDVVYSRFI